MSAVKRVSNDDLWLKPPDDNGDLGPRLGRVRYATIGKPQIFTDGDFHHCGRLGRFLRANLRGSAARHFAGGEIENARRSAEHVRSDQRSAANELHVVGMSGDCKNIDFCHAENLLVTQSVDWIELGCALRG